MTPTNARPPRDCHACATYVAVALAVAACSSSDHGAVVDAASDAGLADSDASALPAPVSPADFDHVLDEAYIRNLETWLDDSAFAVKWADMIQSPIKMLGAADSAYHADLGSRATALPGGEVICHGDAKLDNFGWLLEDGSNIFSDTDFDDAGACPAAADILHFVLATDLQFADPTLDAAAISAYTATLLADGSATAIDPSSVPAWSTVLATGLASDTSGDKITLGGAIVAPSKSDADAVTALAGSDARFPSTLVDVAQDVVTTGGSAGLRRYWLLVEDSTHPRTIIELKELTIPGTEFGPHTVTYDGSGRFDTLKPYWWDAPAPGDHFSVFLLNSYFVARDRYTRVDADPTTLTGAALTNAITAEASMMAHKHRAAWAGYDPRALQPWLAASAHTLAERWRGAYTAANP